MKKLDISNLASITQFRLVSERKTNSRSKSEYRSGWETYLKLMILIPKLLNSVYEILKQTRYKQKIYDQKINFLSKRLNSQIFSRLKSRTAPTRRNTAAPISKWTRRTCATRGSASCTWSTRTGCACRCRCWRPSRPRTTRLWRTLTGAPIELVSWLYHHFGISDRP